MKHTVLKVSRIGNSRGVRIPAGTLERFDIGDSVIMEERAEGILLVPRRTAAPALSWEETASAMAAAGENWDEWDSAAADGLDGIEWKETDSRAVAEPVAGYTAKGRRRGARRK